MYKVTDYWARERGTVDSFAKAKAMLCNDASIYTVEVKRNKVWHVFQDGNPFKIGRIEKV